MAGPESRTSSSRCLRSLAAVALAAASLAASAGPAEGAPTADASIIGGKPAAADWGFVASVHQDGRFNCSGSVVSPTAVVTAAHCVRAGATRLTVWTGRFKLGAPGYQSGVSSVAVHPNYPLAGFPDVAVLRLSVPTPSPPIPLATPSEDAAYVYPGQSLSIAGFGQRNPLVFGKRKVGALMATDVIVRTRCTRDRKFVPAAMICAIGRSLNRYIARDSCRGDSGGPLAALIPEGPRLFGVNSYAYVARFGIRSLIACGNSKLASVYTRVGGAYEFILAQL